MIEVKKRNTRLVFQKRVCEVGDHSPPAGSVCVSRSARPRARTRSWRTLSPQPCSLKRLPNGYEKCTCKWTARWITKLLKFWNAIESPRAS